MSDSSKAVNRMHDYYHAQTSLVITKFNPPEDAKSPTHNRNARLTTQTGAEQLKGLDTFPSP